MWVNIACGPGSQAESQAPGIQDPDVSRHEWGPLGPDSKEHQGTANWNDIQIAYSTMLNKTLSLPLGLAYGLQLPALPLWEGAQIPSRLVTLEILLRIDLGHSPISRGCRMPSSLKQVSLLSGPHGAPCVWASLSISPAFPSTHSSSRASN